MGVTISKTAWHGVRKGERIALTASLDLTMMLFFVLWDPVIEVMYY